MTRLVALLAALLLLASCSHAASKPLLRKAASASAMRVREFRRALLQDDGEAAPVCSLPNVDAASAEPGCPESTDAVTDDDGAITCYTACASLNRRGVSYTPSEDGTRCLPSCPEGTVPASSDDESVTCVSCPWGTSYVPEKNACFAKCGEGPLRGTPIPYDALAPPRCAAPCPALFPIQRAHNRCANRAGRTVARASVVREWARPIQRELPAVPRPSKEPECLKGEPLEDDEGVTRCYACPEGSSLTQDGSGYAVCAADTCSDGYNKCGVYCWSGILADGLGFFDEDYCAAFLDSVSTCMPSCDDVARRRRRVA